MEIVWWTLGVFAIVFCTLWATGVFKKKSKKSLEEDKKSQMNKKLLKSLPRAF